MTINLINGGTVDSEDLNLNRNTYHVYDAYTGEDLTNEIRQSDKVRVFSNFDRTRDNERSANENLYAGKTPPPIGSTSTLTNFYQQVTTDPLQAPIAVALGQGASGPGLGQGTTAKVLKTVVVIAAIGFTLYAINTAIKAKAALS